MRHYLKKKGPYRVSSWKTISCVNLVSVRFLERIFARHRRSKSYWHLFPLLLFYQKRRSWSGLRKFIKTKIVLNIDISTHALMVFCSRILKLTSAKKFILSRMYEAGRSPLRSRREFSAYATSPTSESKPDKSNVGPRSEAASSERSILNKMHEPAQFLLRSPQMSSAYLAFPIAANEPNKSNVGSDPEACRKDREVPVIVGHGLGRPTARGRTVPNSYQRSIESFADWLTPHSGVMLSARQRVPFNPAPMFLFTRTEAGRALESTLTKAGFRGRILDVSKSPPNAANELLFTAQHDEKRVYTEEKHINIKRQMINYRQVRKSVEKAPKTVAGTGQTMPVGTKVISETEVQDSAGSRAKEGLGLKTQVDLKDLTEQVYHMLERKIQVEMERRGL